MHVFKLFFKYVNLIKINKKNNNTCAKSIDKFIYIL